MPSEIAALLATFDTAYQARLGLRYPFVGGKEAKLMQGLLKLYTTPQIESFIAAFFESHDDFIVGSGFSFGAFKGCLPKVIASIHEKTPQKAWSLDWECPHVEACENRRWCEQRQFLPEKYKQRGAA